MRLVRLLGIHFIKALFRAGTKGPAAKRSGFPGPDSIRADVAGATKSKASRGFI